MKSKRFANCFRAITLPAAALLLLILAPQAGPRSGAAYAQSSPSGCVQSLPSGWSNSALPTQLVPFTASFDATPGATPMNGVMGFSSAPATRYEDIAVLVRFSADGLIEAMNGTAYNAAASISYRAGVNYHFRLAINPVLQTYDVYVTPAGGSEIAVALGYAFHVTAPALLIDNWAMSVDSNGPSMTVCNMTTGAVGLPSALLPSIAASPSSQAVTAGQTATFTVAAAGTGPLHYQWYKNGAKVTGATSSTYTTPPVSASDNNAQFAVKVSNLAGSVTSGVAVLSVTSGACVESLPTTWTNTALPDQTAAFTATYDATPDAAPINGTLGFSSGPATRYEDAAALARFSSDGLIEVMNGTAYASATAVQYQAGVSYHFRFVINPAAQTYDVYVTPAGGAEIAVALGYSFHVTAPASDIGNWTITGGGDGPQMSVCNMALSTSPAVFLLPAIVQPPADQSVTAGQTASFSVTATGTGPLSYQWNENGNPIAGATSATYTTAPTTAAENNTQFAVKVSDPAGSVISSVAMLSVASASCMQSAASGWTNTSIPQQSAAFTASYDATPGGVPMNGVMGFSSTPASRYEDLTAMARFSADGLIEVMDGSGYSADTSVPYQAGTSYHFRFVINPSAQTYDVYVTPAGAAEIAVARGYSFHVTAPSSFLNNWAMSVDSNGPAMTVCSMAVSAAGGSSSGISLSLGSSGIGINLGNLGTAALPLTAVPPSVSFGSVGVGNTGSSNVTITNFGSSAIAVTNVSIAGAGFSASGISTGQMVAAGQSAQFNVTYSPAGSGVTTGTLTVQTSAGPTVIALAGNASVQVSAHSVSLAWSASASNVVGYNVYRGTASGGPYAQLTAAPLPGTSYLDGTVAAGQTYFYVVTAVDQSGAESGFSAETTAAIP